MWYPMLTSCIDGTEYSLSSVPHFISLCCYKIHFKIFLLVSSSYLVLIGIKQGVSMSASLQTNTQLLVWQGNYGIALVSFSLPLSLYVVFFASHWQKREIHKTTGYLFWPAAVYSDTHGWPLYPETNLPPDGHSKRKRMGTWQHKAVGSNLDVKYDRTVFLLVCQQLTNREK